jgi:hypothetical protein
MTASSEETEAINSFREALDEKINERYSDEVCASLRNVKQLRMALHLGRKF